MFLAKGKRAVSSNTWFNIKVMVSGAAVHVLIDVSNILSPS